MLDGLPTARPISEDAVAFRAVGLVPTPDPGRTRQAGVYGWGAGQVSLYLFLQGIVLLLSFAPPLRGLGPPSPHETLDCGDLPGSSGKRLKDQVLACRSDRLIFTYVCVTRYGHRYPGPYWRYGNYGLSKRQGFYAFSLAPSATAMYPPCDGDLITGWRFAPAQPPGQTELEAKEEESDETHAQLLLDAGRRRTSRTSRKSNRLTIFRGQSDG